MGIAEKKTNHSLRATGATALFSANVPEKIIRDVTGHRSNALELYEHPTLQQRRAVSGVLVQGKQSFTSESEKENREGSKEPKRTPSALQPCHSSPIGALFSGLSDCNVLMAPQNFIINIGSTPSTAQPIVEAQCETFVDSVIASNIEL